MTQNFFKNTNKIKILNDSQIFFVKTSTADIKKWRNLRVVDLKIFYSTCFCFIAISAGPKYFTENLQSLGHNVAFYAEIRFRGETSCLAFKEETCLKMSFDKFIILWIKTWQASRQPNCLHLKKNLIFF